MKLTDKRIKTASASANPIASSLLNCGNIIFIVAIVLASLEIFGGFIAGLVLMCDYAVAEGFITIIASILSSICTLGAALFVRLILASFAELIQINYRTQMLTELWLSAHAEEDKPAPVVRTIRQDAPQPNSTVPEATNSTATGSTSEEGIVFKRVTSGETGFITCPHCKRKQTAEHINCMICGKPLRENN